MDIPSFFFIIMFKFPQVVIQTTIGRKDLKSVS